MARNLLHKTLRYYIIFAIVVLCFCAPLFYLMTYRLYINSADEVLTIRKKEFILIHTPSIKRSDIPTWNRFNRDIKIEDPVLTIKEDIILNEFYYDSLDNENEPYRVLRTPVLIEGKTYTLLARINMVETQDLIKSIAIVFIGLLLVLLIGLYFITMRLSLKLWRPFYDTLHFIEKFEVDKIPQNNLMATEINEFNRLNHAIENLIQKNTAIYNSQKEFIENAAHELQTPLAVFQGKLDILIQQTNLTQNQSEILDKLNDAVARLTRLNKNLLLLSKIDNDQFQDKDSISLTQEVTKHIDFFSEQATSKNIKIHIDALPEVKARANSFLTEILISNLFLNAIKYNVADG
ncbi:MAG: HAMP domain-containing sensor histidine kinase, partial [Saprospiraceae bacterium]